MIVTIDGPAGAGKSTVARALADLLNFNFLDTGAMYRAVALAAIRRELSFDAPEEIAGLAKEVNITVDRQHVYLDGEDVSDAIRTREVTANTRYAADNPLVRDRMVVLQREAAAGCDLVTEGRDQGSVVFPDAECKVFLSASADERARRRQADLSQRGEQVDFDAILKEQNDRDQRDYDRPVAPLVCPPDAHVVETDGMSGEQVVEALAELVQQVLAGRGEA